MSLEVRSSSPSQSEAAFALSNTIRFSILATLAALSSGVVAQFSGAQVVESINDLTTKSQNLIPQAQSITIVNAQLFIIGQGPFPVRITYSLLYYVSIRALKMLRKKH